MKTIVNNYKVCKTSNSAYLPFNDEQVVTAFDAAVRNRYRTVLNGIVGFVDEFLDLSEVVRKDVNLVKTLINLIQKDQSIAGEEEFYIEPTRRKKEKGRTWRP